MNFIWTWHLNRSFIGQCHHFKCLTRISSWSILQAQICFHLWMPVDLDSCLWNTHVADSMESHAAWSMPSWLSLHICSQNGQSSIQQWAPVTLCWPLLPNTRIELTLRRQIFVAAGVHFKWFWFLLAALHWITNETRSTRSVLTNQLTVVQVSILLHPCESMTAWIGSQTWKVVKLYGPMLLKCWVVLNWRSQIDLISKVWGALERRETRKN